MSPKVEGKMGPELMKLGHSGIQISYMFNHFHTYLIAHHIKLI